MIMCLIFLVAAPPLATAVAVPTHALVGVCCACDDMCAGEQCIVSRSSIYTCGYEVSIAYPSIDTVSTYTASIFHSALTGSLTKDPAMTHLLQGLRALHLQRVGYRIGSGGELVLAGLIRCFDAPLEQSCVCKNKVRHAVWRMHVGTIQQSYFLLQPP